jgi:hypothetical protein
MHVSSAHGTRRATDTTPATCDKSMASGFFSLLSCSCSVVCIFCEGGFCRYTFCMFKAIRFPQIFIPRVKARVNFNTAISVEFSPSSLKKNGGCFGGPPGPSSAYAAHRADDRPGLADGAALPSQVDVLHPVRARGCRARGG